MRTFLLALCCLAALTACGKKPRVLEAPSQASERLADPVNQNNSGIISH